MYRAYEKYKWIIELPKDTKFVVFDTETTGLYPESCNILEIGAISFLLRKEMETFGSFINPGVRVPSKITEITGITDEMIKDAPSTKNVLIKFVEFIGDSILIAHNAKFDIDFVNQELKRHDMPLLTNKVIDTRWLTKDLFTDQPNYKLQSLAENFKLEVKDAHRAYDDARVCMKLFLTDIRKICKDMAEDKKEKVNGN